MAKCINKDCKNEARGFSILTTGGSTHVRECDDHLPDHLKDRLAPAAGVASAVPSRSETNGKTKK
jgi:hypothetical protein